MANPIWASSMVVLTRLSATMVFHAVVIPSDQYMSSNIKTDNAAL